MSGFSQQRFCLIDMDIVGEGENPPLFCIHRNRMGLNPIPTINVVMLTFGIFTELCTPVEKIVYTKIIPDLSTVFSETLVEKPVENVDNSLLTTIFHRLLF